MAIGFPIQLILGLVLGWLSGLGVGGGSLLILWLTLVVQMPQAEARTVNLMYFLVCAGAATLVRRKQGRLSRSFHPPAILAGCISAITFTWLGGLADLTQLHRIFGILLIFTGLRELFYRPRELR